MEIGNEIVVFQDKMGIALRCTNMKLFFRSSISGDFCKVGIRLRFVRAAQTTKHRQAQQEKQHSLAWCPLESHDIKAFPPSTRHNQPKNNIKGNRFSKSVTLQFIPYTY